MKSIHFQRAAALLEKEVETVEIERDLLRTLLSELDDQYQELDEWAHHSCPAPEPSVDDLAFASGERYPRLKDLVDAYVEKCVARRSEWGVADRNLAYAAIEDWIETEAAAHTI